MDDKATPRLLQSHRPGGLHRPGQDRPSCPRHEPLVGPDWMGSRLIFMRRSDSRSSGATLAAMGHSDSAAGVAHHGFMAPGRPAARARRS